MKLNEKIAFYHIGLRYKGKIVNIVGNILWVAVDAGERLPQIYAVHKKQCRRIKKHG